MLSTSSLIQLCVVCYKFQYNDLFFTFVIVPVYITFIMSIMEIRCTQVNLTKTLKHNETGKKG